MKKISLIIFLSLVFAASAAHGHSVWINSFESQAHQAPHAIVSLGWGHALPMDDILNSPNGRIEIERFELLSPDLTSTPLLKRELQEGKPDLVAKNFELFHADLAAQKVALKKDSAPGVYQFSAVSKPGFFTQYVDGAGRTRLQMKPLDEVPDVSRVLMSVKYQAFAKAYLTVGQWADPKPLGHGLEIVPRTDLSDLRPGDLVEVEVLFSGQPLNSTAKSMEYITAQSSGFGQSDGFALISYIIDGRARFRVQSAGQWIIMVNHKDDVTADGPLKELSGKAEQAYHAASLTFQVK